jgi:hypothetical protein
MSAFASGNTAQNIPEVWVPKSSPYADPRYANLANEDDNEIGAGTGFETRCYIESEDGSVRYLSAPDTHFFKKRMQAIINSYYYGNLPDDWSGGEKEKYLHHETNEWALHDKDAGEDNGEYWKDGTDPSSGADWGGDDEDADSDEIRKTVPKVLENDIWGDEGKVEKLRNNGTHRGYYLGYRVDRLLKLTQGQAVSHDGETGDPAKAHSFIKSILPTEYLNKADFSPGALLANVPPGCQPEVVVALTSTPGGFVDFIKNPINWIGGLLAWLIQVPFTAIYKFTEPVAFQLMFFTPHVERGDSVSNIKDCGSGDSNCETTGFRQSSIDKLEANDLSENRVGRLYMYFRTLMGSFYFLGLVIAGIVYMGKGKEAKNFNAARMIPRLFIVTAALVAFPYLFSTLVTFSNFATQSILSSGFDCGAISNCTVRSAYASTLNNMTAVTDNGLGTLAMSVLKVLTLMVSSVALLILTMLSFLRHLLLAALVAAAPLALTMFLVESWRTGFAKYLRWMAAALAAPPLMAFVALLGGAFNPLMGADPANVSVGNAVGGAFMLIVSFIGMIFVAKALISFARGGGKEGTSLLGLGAVVAGGMAGRASARRLNKGDGDANRLRSSRDGSGAGRSLKGPRSTGRKPGGATAGRVGTVTPKGLPTGSSTPLGKKSADNKPAPTKSKVQVGKDALSDLRVLPPKESTGGQKAVWAATLGLGTAARLGEKAVGKVTPDAVKSSRAGQMMGRAYTGAAKLPARALDKTGAGVARVAKSGAAQEGRAILKDLGMTRGGGAARAYRSTSQMYEQGAAGSMGPIFNTPVDPYMMMSQAAPLVRGGSSDAKASVTNITVNQTTTNTTTGSTETKTETKSESPSSGGQPKPKRKGYVAPDDVAKNVTEAVKKAPHEM